MSIQQTAAELEASLGEQVRAERLRSNTSVADVALRAGLSINAVRRLERGDGATVATLVRVLRALGREAWLGSLQPAITVSPLQMLRSTQPRQRASATRSTAAP